MSDNHYDEDYITEAGAMIDKNLAIMMLRKLDNVSNTTAQTITSIARIEERLNSVASLTASVDKQSGTLTKLAGDMEKIIVRTDNQQKEIDCLQEDSRWARRMVAGAAFAAVLSFVGSLILFFMTR